MPCGVGSVGDEPVLVWIGRVCNETKWPKLSSQIARMLVTSFIFQKSRCIFFPCWFLKQCQTPPVPFM